MLPSDPSTPETAPTPGELASSSPAGLEVPPTPVTPRPSGGARGPILGLAMILARGRLERMPRRSALGRLAGFAPLIASVAVLGLGVVLTWQAVAGRPVL
jgi:hypothetical protein